MPDVATTESDTAIPMRLRAWKIATRPHTLPVSVNPVLVGCALAWSAQGRIEPVWMLLALLGAMLLQLGTNLDNDVSDFQRGADAAGRLGLPRATALGLLSARQVRRASLGCFAAATVFGLLLAWRGGWPILLAGLASAAAAMTYAGGPRPTSYTPLGDVLVWLFFGPVAVCGTYWLQTPSLTPAALLASCIVGLPAAAVLVVNNYRDLDLDRAVGKRTLAVVLGRRRTRIEYAALVLTPLALLLPLAVASAAGWWMLLPLAALPEAMGLVRRFRRELPGRGFNPLLARTARFQVLLSLLLCVALVAPRLLAL